MNFLPSPPTDSLFKFMAITGSYLLAGLLAAVMFFLYLDFQDVRESRRFQDYTDSKRKVSKMTKRLASIAEGKFSENRLDWIEPGTPIVEEERYIKAGLENHGEFIQNNKDVRPPNMSEKFQLIEALGFRWIMPLYVLLAFGCFIFGFFGWYRKVQVPSEHAHALDCKIKEATVRKLELEIHELPKSKKYSTRRQH